jgi:hypothetical protein
MLPIKEIPLQGITQEDVSKMSPAELKNLQELQASGATTFWDFDADGKKGYPLERFIMEAFGGGMSSGQVEIIRLQKSFYGKDLPLYGSAHMPDLDSGLYSSSIGSILESNEMVQIC